MWVSLHIVVSNFKNIISALDIFGRVFTSCKKIRCKNSYYRNCRSEVFFEIGVFKIFKKYMCRISFFSIVASFKCESC